jgi:ABC-type multidrug transport system ATPase subunit
MPERLGDKVIEVEGLTKAYGDKLLFDDLSFKLPPGGIVGVIGPNGAGKTTLFRMITGQETARRGDDRDRRDGASSAMSTRAATRSTRTRRLGGDLGRQRHHLSSASAR